MPTRSNPSRRTLRAAVHAPRLAWTRAAALIAALLGASATPAAAQVDPAAATRATSVTVGGFLIADSRLALAKVEHARGRWSLVGDVTRDGVHERWSTSATQVASRGEYVMWSASAAARRYTRPRARGFFAEASGGVARAALEVTPDGGVAAATRRATVPLAAWGVGGRFGIGRSPAFAELGYRSAIPLATRHLYTDPAPPEGSTRESVTYHSWYFGRGKPTSQMYVGLGLTL
jgi:hypothetical protein